MYKLVLIDDEQVVRRNIIKKIQWERYGFTVVGEAENGREALDLIETINPEVVITDIEMPFINGLELSRLIREKYPMTKIVVLTGYDEFKYAQEAIKLNVLEYVLKPVSSEDLISILTKLKFRIDTEIAQIEDINALRQHYIQNLPVLKANFFNSLIRSRQEKKEILSKADYLQIDVEGSQFAAIVISIDKNSLNNQTFSKDDHELVKFAVLNSSEFIITSRNLGYTFSCDNYVVGICKSNAREKTVFLSEIFRTAEEIRQSIGKYIKVTVAVGIGKICSEIEYLAESYDSALAALDYRFVVGNSKPIYISDLEPHSDRKVSFDQKKEQLLLTSLRVGMEKQVIDTIDLIFSDITDGQASLSDYQIYLIEVLSSIVKISKNLYADINILIGETNNLFIEMLSFGSIQDVKRWFIKICINLMKYIKDNRQNSCKIIVQAAKQFIVEEQHNSELSLNSLCNFLHISPSYFGTIFKNETGETFLGFLLRVRMEKAKELISTTGMKNFEVAEKVGYPDQHYFSYSFKKYYGESPNEFRNHLKSR